MGSVSLLALAIIAWAAAAPQVGTRASDARWGESAAFSLKATFSVRSVPPTVTGRSRSGTEGVAASNWSPRLPGGAGPGRSARGAGRAPFNLETLPVTIGGQRFVLSRFTMSRAGVRGMISTAF